MYSDMTTDETAKQHNVLSTVITSNFFYLLIGTNC